jgi:flagellar biosynthesis anti-sigma factor FlgM
MSFHGISPRFRPMSILFGTDHTRPANGKHSNIASMKSQDDVDFSDQSMEFLRIRNLVDSLPDFRLDRVNQLAKAIDEGTYHPTGQQIADAIIRKHLIDFDA